MTAPHPLRAGEVLLWQGQAAPMRTSRTAFLVVWTALATGLMLASGTHPALIALFVAFILAGAVATHLCLQDRYLITNQRAIAIRAGVLRGKGVREIPIEGAVPTTRRSHVMLRRALGGRVDFNHLHNADRLWLLTHVPKLAVPFDAP